MRELYLGFCIVVILWFIQAEWYGKVFSDVMPKVFRTSSSGYNHK